MVGQWHWIHFQPKLEIINCEEIRRQFCMNITLFSGSTQFLPIFSTLSSVAIRHATDSAEPRSSPPAQVCLLCWCLVLTLPTALRYGLACHDYAFGCCIGWAQSTLHVSTAFGCIECSCASRTKRVIKCMDISERTKTRGQTTPDKEKNNSAEHNLIKVKQKKWLRFT